jgi:hypothetical protein
MSNKRHRAPGCQLFILLAIVLSSCGVRNVPFGPLSQARLSSNEELEVLEALIRLEEEDEFSPEARKLLAEIHKDPRHLHVTRALATLRATQSLDDLKRIIVDEKQDIIIRVSASMTLLGKESPADAVQYVASVLEDHQYPLPVRFAVMVALLMGDENNDKFDGRFDGSVLVRLAKDTRHEPLIRRLALAGLGDYRVKPPPGMLEALVGALQSQDDEQALAAAEALARFRDTYEEFPPENKTEIHSALADIAFNESKPTDLRIVALAAIREIDLIADMRERALKIFHNPQADTDLRHAAAQSVLTSDKEDASRAAAHLGVLSDPAASQLLRDDALQLLNVSDTKSQFFISAVKAALPTISPMLAKNQGTDAHRATLISLLDSLAEQGLLLDEMAQALPMLKVIARDPQEGSRAQEAAIGLLTTLADRSKTDAAFLESMVKDPMVNAWTRAQIIDGLSKTAKAYLPGSLLMPLCREASIPLTVRQAALAALGNLGTEARPYKDDLLKLAAAEQDLQLKYNVLLALSKLKSPSEDIANLAADLLLETSAKVNYNQGAIPPILGELGSSARSVLARLTQALDDPQRSDKEKRTIAKAIAAIAVSLDDAQAVAAIEELEAASQRLEKLNIKEPQAEVLRAIRGLRNAWFKGMVHGLGTFITEHWALTAGLLYLLLAFTTGLLLLHFSPLSIHRFDAWARHLPELQLPSFLGGHVLSARPLLVVTVFRHHPYVLDAWVESVLPTVRSEFSEKKAVHLRQLYIPLPVELDDADVPTLTPAKLRDFTSRQRFLLAVEGEGGAGKSSLAFQIGGWGMSADPSERLADFAMIPLLLDSDLPERKQTVLAAIRAELLSLTRSQEKLPDDFILELLARQRVLVVADRVSELSDYTQQQLRSAVVDLPISAFLLTSRHEETWPGTSKATLRPVRISGSSVSQFLDAYLKKRGVRTLFQDEHFFEVCRGLSSLARERDITPLLAKMYAEYAADRKLAAQKAQASRDGASAASNQAANTPMPVTDEPKSVPELISRYVDHISESVHGPFAQHMVHDILQAIAWECVKEGFRPASAPLERVLAKLKEKPDEQLKLTNEQLLKEKEEAQLKLANEKLMFAIDRLGIVQLTGLGKDQVRFALDPVAEYLAAMVMLQTNDANELLWNPELHRLQTILQKEPVHAFVQVLMDCCMTELGKNVPQPVLKRIQGMLPPASHPLARASA